MGPTTSSATSSKAEKEEETYVLLPSFASLSVRLLSCNAAYPDTIPNQSHDIHTIPAERTID
jgi:hypothetical protein